MQVELHNSLEAVWGATYITGNSDKVTLARDGIDPDESPGLELTFRLAGETIRKLGGESTTRAGLTGLSMNSRPWNLRPVEPNEGQKFAKELTQEMGPLVSYTVQITGGSDCSK